MSVSTYLWGRHKLREWETVGIWEGGGKYDMDYVVGREKGLPAWFFLFASRSVFCSDSPACLNNQHDESSPPTGSYTRQLKYRKTDIRIIKDEP